MSSARLKALIGIALTILTLVAVATGVILHLKSHGIVIEPRKTIKVIHWTIGLAATVLVIVHRAQFARILTAMKQRFRWFHLDTVLLAAAFAATALTGLVKLLSPVKIPHLGLWHYWLGIVMCAAMLLHLLRGVPALLRVWMSKK